MQLYSGVLLKTADNKLILQQRDNKPGITNPGMIAIFGGTAKKGETPIDCAKREIAEEVNLTVNDKDLKPLGVYKVDVPNVGKVESHIYLVENVKEKDLHLNEGKSLFILDPDKNMAKLNLTPVCRLVLEGIYGFERF